MKELKKFGNENDARVSDHTRMMLNITPETGVFLSVLVQAIRPARNLEIGTSNGYSTIWLAEAAQKIGGRVTTVEVLPEKAEMARRNLARAELSPWIASHLGDAGEFLAKQSSESFEFIFLEMVLKQKPA
ncbi:MAG: hypothetical protein A2Z03_07380 [Chloroflexi bacterium RBG_16_56_8]|nr:MAG: hypothetical protein A2Z03_07380 [Chloroflexi bacterium RBG_16_56_8]